jgi:hypothetical protein
MRALSVMLVLGVAACGGERESSADQVHSIVTPIVTIAPGEEKFICFATSLPTTAEIGVKRWTSKMTPGSHHMIVYASDDAWAPDGTVKECPALSIIAGPSGRPPVWAYASQEASAELPSPPGVGVVLQPGQHLIVNLHYLNASSKPLEAHAEIGIEAYAPGEEYIPAASIATYNTQINVPPKGRQSVEGACDVPAGSKFFALSTHSHRFTTRATVSDGDHVLADTTDWEHPALVRFDAPFVELTTGKLTYRCDYDNPTDQTITTGESAEKNEMCMGVGYIFPAKRSSFCVNSTVVRGGT